MAMEVIAEIGTTHAGSLEAAEKLVQAAAEAGADTAKFQLVIASEIIHPNTGSVDLPGGPIGLYERFRSLERPPDFYASLKELTEAAGLRFLCTAFGLSSLELLSRLGEPRVKLASPELNHIPLLEDIARRKWEAILSTGVSTLADIELALDTIGRERVSILHCITAYPAPETEYNLRLVPGLRDVLGVEVGVSDHSLDPVIVPALATAMGANRIEKHFTLSREGAGLDDPIALEPRDFSSMVDAIRRVEESDAGAPRLETARAEIAEHDRSSPGSTLGHTDFIERVLGDGVKRLAPSEQRNYGRSNRSLHALERIEAGEVLSMDKIGVLRTEHHLRPGIHPRYWKLVEGVPAARRIPSGEGIRWQDLLPRS